MTKEKIIQRLYRGDSRAIKEAIKALEQESILDKIRAEIMDTNKKLMGIQNFLKT